MARTKLNQRSASRVDVPMDATGGRPPSKFAIAVLVVSILTAIWAAAMLTPFGRVGYYYLFVYSEYYMGVLTLVALSITIMVGLVATDRLVLSIRQRVLLQSAHRTTGVIAVTSLVVHVWTKVVEQHIRVIDIFVPFLATYNTVYVGMGTLSGLIMVLVMWTGIARSRFIGKGKPWMWRAMHAVSYLMWPIALVHGLAAGRAAATWVIASYVVCVLFVLAGLAVRLSVSLNRRKDFSSATGAMKPVGSLVPTQAPSPKEKPARRPEPVRAASPMPASPMPASPMPAGPMPVSGSRYDEPTGRISRRALEDDRRYDRADAEPAPRGRRRAEDRYDEVPRPRRDPDVRTTGEFRAGEFGWTGDAPLAPRSGGSTRYPDGDEAAFLARRGRAAAAHRANSGRHSRSDFVDLAAPAGPWRGQADPNYMEPDETPTLVDIASRRARKQAQQDTGRTTTRSARRGGRKRSTDDALDDPQYWRQLRGEAQ